MAIWYLILGARGTPPRTPLSLVYGKVTIRHPERVFPPLKHKSPTVFRGYWCQRADKAGTLWIAQHRLAVAWQQEMAF